MIILIRNVKFMFFILWRYELLTSIKRSRLSFVFLSLNTEYVFNNRIKFYYILTKNKDYRKWWGDKHLPPVIYFHRDIIINRTNRSLLKHWCLSKQGVLLENARMDFQILLCADRKCFLLANCQTLNIWSCFTVPRHPFLYWLSHNNK